jgi:periplasmic glucans biosynthesis protein
MRSARSFLNPWLIALAAMSWWPAAADAFGWSEVVALAERRAAEPYREPQKIPDFLRELSYEQARRFRFLHERRLWRTGNPSFQVSFVAPARHLDHPVRIHRIASDGVHAVPFERDYFDFGDPELVKRIPPDLGFAGFRVHYGARSDDRPVVMEFSAASYFRATGRDGVLGQWARGLAIDTGLPSGEEFPAFTEFWLEQPRPDAAELRIYALLDGPRVTGGYEFLITPGDATRIAVRAALFVREGIDLFGIAPLTSMFFYGENTPRPLGQWRPEVHNSDGLSIHDGNGEWLWRPLLNPRAPEIYTFAVADARGFGLLQRDRRFDAYEDGDAGYERQPGAWVALDEPAGPGRIVLVEIPSPDETNDNMVAFWSPRQPVPAGQRRRLEYEVRFGPAPAPEQPVAAVVNTLVGRAQGSDRRLSADSYRFAVDFAGGPLDQVRDPEAQVLGEVTVAGGKVLEQYVEYLEAAGRWRLVFTARPENESGMEMRAFLRRDDQTLTETWSYHLPWINSLTP